MNGSVFAGARAGLVIGAVFLVMLIMIIPSLADWKAKALSGRDSARSEMLALESRSTALTQSLHSLSDNQIDAYLWAAEEIGVATARVQSEINTLSTQSGMALRTISPIGESEAGGVKLLKFRLEAEATLDQLSKFLQAAEYKHPVIFVEAANMRRLNRPNTSTVQPVVFVQIELSAPVSVTEELSQ